MYTYNNRLQMSGAYAIVAGDPNRFLTNWSLDWGGNQNNGTLRGRIESFGNQVPASQMPGVAQTFSYDSLNRLTAFTDYGSSRNYSYDTWGNGWLTNNNGLPLQGNTPTSNVYNGANQMGGGRSYDAAGNQTNVNGDTLTYDAENRLIAATEPAALGGATEPFIYDALGQRTIRQYPGNWVSYAYDAFGRKAATYNYWTSLNQEFIYLNGQLVATENFNNNGSPCATCYYVWDHLGSPRLVTDSSGNVVARHDYLPFGEEIPGGWAGRSSQWGVNDGTRDKFTGQERDAETGLDYFNARYFAGALGRFTSPDPMNAGAVLTDPQTWNGYSYVRNSPMTFTDPSGASFWGLLSTIGDAIEQGFSDFLGLGGCGADFCATGVASAPIDTSGSGGSYLLNGSGSNGSGSSTGDESTGSGVLFQATGLGKADVPTVNTPPKKVLKSGTIPPWIVAGTEPQEAFYRKRQK